MNRHYEKRRSRSPSSSTNSNSRGNRIDLQYIPLSNNNSKDILRHSKDSRGNHNSHSRSPSSERNGKQHARRKQQIVYDDNSRSSRSSRSRNRSRSPIIYNSHNIPPDDRRKNDYNGSNRSVFSRLGSDPPQRYSASPSRWQNLKDISGSSSLEPDQMRIVVRNDNYQGRSSFPATAPPPPHNHSLVDDNKSEIIYAIKCLEQQNRDNMRHIDGIRSTIENYHREIAKLEAIVLSSSHEIEKLKSQFYHH